MNELERLEAELSELESLLSDSAHRERATAATLDSQTAAARGLRARIETLRSEAPPAAPPAGTLTGTGHWEPLPLGSNDDASNEPAIDLQPEADPVAISAFLADFVIRPTEQKRKQLSRLRKKYGHQEAISRLLEAGFFSTHARREQIDLHTKYWPLVTPAALRTVTVELPWLTSATELPNPIDGVTTTQRRLIEAIERRAPMNRAAQPIEVIERESGLPSTTVQHALLALAHPAIRPLPIVELFSAEGPFRSHDEVISRVRMGRWPDWRTLPLGLINGAAGIGTSAPPRNPFAVIRIIRNLINETREWWQEGPASERPMFPNTPSVMPRWASLHSGDAEVLVHPRISSGLGGQILIDAVPWPLRVGVLRQQIETPHIDGVVAVRDVSSATHSELIVDLEHPVFARQVLSQMRLQADLQVRWNAGHWVDLEGRSRNPTFIQLANLWLGERLRGMSAEGPDLAPLELRTLQLEALFLARSMLAPVQATLREALDDTEAVALLVTFFEKNDRLVLPTMIERSHDYARGFNEAQAKFLVKVKKLQNHSLETIARDWQAAIDQLDEARRPTRSRYQLGLALDQQLEDFAERLRALPSP